MKTRLRDGREMTVGELKKLADRAQELESAQSRWQAEQQQAQQLTQRVAQQGAFFQQAIQNAIAIQQAHMPSAPDPSLRETDPIEYFMQKDRYETESAKLNSLVQQQHTAQAERMRQVQQHQAKAQEAQSQQLRAYLQEQQSLLLDKMPELRSPQVAQKFMEELKTGAREYGFSDEETAKIYDHRLLPVIKDALAFRALQKQKPAVQAKASNAAPVQPPGRRVTQAEAQNRNYTDKLSQLRKSGSQDLAASIIEDLL
jgi:hypothetical protein